MTKYGHLNEIARRQCFWQGIHTTKTYKRHSGERYKSGWRRVSYR
jgi:hypothetical protein